MQQLQVHTYALYILSIFTFLSTGAGKSYQNKRVIVFQEEVIPGNGCSPIWAVEAMLFGIGNATLPLVAKPCAVI